MFDINAAYLARQVSVVPLTEVVRECVVETKKGFWKEFCKQVGWHALKVTGAAVVLYGGSWWLSRQLDDVENLTWWLRLFSCRVKHDLRCKVAYDFSVHQQKGEMLNHTHPDAAKHRNEILRTFEDFIASCGRVPYHISMSKRETGVGYAMWYDAKDTAIDPKRDKVLPHHFLMGVDVDYYLNLSEWARYGLPLVFYTMAPKRLAGETVDATHYIDGQGRLVVDVRGGGSYVHQLWAYDSDTIVFDYWFGSIVYSLEMRDVGNERMVVFLLPIITLYTPLGWLIPGSRPRRRNFVRGKMAIQLSIDKRDGKTKRFVSISPLGSTVCAYIPEEALYSAAVSYGTSTKASAASIMGLLNVYLEKPHYQEKDVATIARILLDSFCNGEFRNLETRHDATVGQIHRGFIVTTGDPRAPQWTDEDAKLHAREVSAPLVTQPAVVPADCKANDIGAIVGRLEKVRNTAVPTSSKMMVWSAEFDGLVLGTKVGKLQPWGYDEVYAAKTGSRPRARMDQVWDWLTGRSFKSVVVKAFVKTEPYVKINDPRNISTLPTEHNLELARFEYAFKTEVSAYLSWYAPGQKLERIAQDLADYAQLDGVLLEADRSRMDGSFSAWEAEQDQRMVARAFAPPFSDDYLRLCEEEDGARGRTKTGVVYQTGSDTKSGSDRTTGRNSRASGRIVYCALRKAGYGMQQAWERIGKVAGDDLVPRCGNAKAFQWVANQIGAKYDFTIRKPGEVVTFLARHFPNLWSGDAGSVQDPYRLLSKIHITCSDKNIPVAEAMVNKANGLRDLDPANELTVAYADALLRVVRYDMGIDPASVKVRDDDLSYWQWYAKQENCGNWPQLSPEDAQSYVCKTLNLMPGEYDYLVTKLDDCFTRKDLMELPQLIHRVMPASVPAYIVGSQFEGPPQPTKPTYEEVIDKWAKKAVPRMNRPKQSKPARSRGNPPRRTRAP